jgi:hypothetical protein
MELFGTHAIKDDQLRMMFSCCHPRLPEEAQVALVLHLLCGFTVSWSFAWERRTGRANTFAQRSLLRVVRWSAGSSLNESMTVAQMKRGR